jgi:hypothetical protein
MGDSPLPVITLNSIRAAISSAYRIHTRDKGAGEYATGMLQLYYHRKYDIQVSDVIYVEKGPMIGTWWIVQLPTQITKAKHREAGVVPYQGKKPVVP